MGVGAAVVGGGEGGTERNLVHLHTIIRPPDLHGQFSQTLNAQQEAVATQQMSMSPQEAKTELYTLLSQVHPSMVRAHQMFSATETFLLGN